MADEVKAATRGATRRRDVHGVGDQFVEFVVCGIGGIRPGTRGIAALAWRDGPVSRRRQRGKLRSPRMEGFRKAVQQQHERCVFRSINQYIED
jgi:hypothetical protein